MKLNWSPQAIADLEGIRRYIYGDDPQAARTVVATILAIIETQLSSYPYSGRPGRVAGTLELVISGLPYVVPHRVTATGIDILGVYHAFRRWPDQF